MRIECTTLIALQEVGAMIKKTDKRTILKWLDDKNISIESQRPKLVYKWWVEYHIQLAMVDSLKKQEPQRWAEIYDASGIDEAMKRAVFIARPRDLNIEVNQTKKPIPNYFK